MSVADFVIAAGLVTGLMCTITVNYVYSARVFSRLQNYMYLDSKSRYAMDRINRDIRQADSITSYSSNQLTFLLSGTNVTYNYDSTQKCLFRQTPSSKTLYLTNCNYCRFDVFQRITTSNSFTLVPATNTSVAKVVQMDWACSKKVTGEADTTENVQSATITIRKK